MKTNELVDLLKRVASLPEGDIEQLASVVSAAAKEGKKAKPSRRPESVSYLTPEETASLFRTTKDVFKTALLRVAYHRGLRASELGLLSLSDFRQREGRLFTHRLKGSNSGEDRLFDEELRALRAWVKKRGQAPGPLFVTRNKTAIGRQRVWEIVREQCAAAGIPPEKAHPHTLKHTCGTDYYARTRDIRAVQAHLGHRNIQNTLIYAAITDTYRDETALKNRDWK
jgi:integrase